MVTSSMLKFMAFAFCLSHVAAVCYLEDSASTCSVCWRTVYANKDDKVGVTKMAECEEQVQAAYDVPLPDLMYEGTEYPVTFSLTHDNVANIVPGSTKNDGMKGVPHANIHSCISSRGACTPFVANTPGLSTHTPASVGDFEGKKATFEGLVDLPVDTYTIIAHIRFFEPNAEDPENGKPTKVDVAVGVQREVLPQVSEISAEAYIMAGVVGAIILLMGGMIYYAVRTGKVDLDYIMALMFSDYVTLPSDIICGLADAAAFTISILTTVHGNNDLTHIVPICWMFAALSYLVSAYCAYYDYYQIWDLYQSYYDEQKYDERMLANLSTDWTLRHAPKKGDGKISNTEKKAVARRISQDWDVKRMASSTGVHHQTMVDYDMAMQDFARRRRTIASIILESVPITAIQTYIMVEGGSGTVATLALLLASLLLGSKMQGLGDYGNAKQRKAETQAKFDQMFGGVERLYSAHAKVNNRPAPALPAALGGGSESSSDLESGHQAPAQAEMFVAVPSSGGGIQATPRTVPQPYALAGQEARPAPYQPPSTVHYGVPPPLYTPRDVGGYPMAVQAPNPHLAGRA